MKVLILNGFYKMNIDYMRIMRILRDKLQLCENVEEILLKEKKINPCTGCFGCWLKNPGICIIDDDSQDVVRKIINSDIVIYLTPVVFGGYSYELKKLLDKTICLLAPEFINIDKEMHHKKRYEKYPGILGIGVLNRHDDEAEMNFRELIYRNSINMHSPLHGAEVILSEDTEADVVNKLLGLMLKQKETT